MASGEWQVKGKQSNEKPVAGLTVLRKVLRQNKQKLHIVIEVLAFAHSRRLGHLLTLSIVIILTDSTIPVHHLNMV